MKRFQYLFLLMIAVLLTSCRVDDSFSDPSEKEWQHYNAGPSGHQYSPLSQINKSNVGQLEIAWVYDLASEEPITTIKCQPLMIEGTVYAITASRNLVALDAGTGSKKWYLDFHSLDSLGRQGTARGINFWERESDRRIFYVYSNFLYAINADDGSPVQSFGENGRIPFDLGLNISSNFSVRSTTPGIIYEDLLIMGSMVSERWPAAPGHIRAFNVITGALEWVFHTIPQPGEYGYETWPEGAYRYIGGANNWAGMSLDLERGIVYIPTASPTFDFYGANRHGQNLFANCLLALDAKTGKRLWHFQTVHHDLWDRDLPCAPKLMSVFHEGKKKEIVVQPTKQGWIFIFDRLTGVPLFQINELPVPPSSIEGEAAWPTQPIPSWPLPFTRLEMSEDLITGINPEASSYVRNKLTKMGTTLFAPPDTSGVVIQPDFGGGAGWGGAAVDEKRRTLVINANDFPGILQLFDQESERAALKLTGSNLYRIHCGSCHGEKFQGGHFYPPLTNITQKYSSREIAGILEKGMGAMPSYSFLTYEERKSIIAFLSGNNYELQNTGKTSQPDPREVHLKYAHRGNLVFEDDKGYPAIKPPWATLTAYNIDSWEVKWQKTLGTYEELTEIGGAPTGIKTLGGPITTASGLIFIASTTDKQFRAFDIDSGEMLWQYRLPGAGLATPITYEWEGAQYLVIAVSGDAKKKEKGQYVAFKVP